MTAPAWMELDRSAVHETAADLGIDPNLILAIAIVEAGEWPAMIAPGEPLQLFEHDLFTRFTNGLHKGGQWQPGGPYGPMRVQPQRVMQAARLDIVAAYRATSWGWPQILGNNAAACGFTLEDGKPDVLGFVASMRTGPVAHLTAFANFVRSSKPLHDAFRRGDYRGIARWYNGPAFARHNYHGRLEEARRKAQARE